MLSMTSNLLRSGECKREVTEKSSYLNRTGSVFYIVKKETDDCIVYTELHLLICANPLDQILSKTVQANFIDKQ